MRKLQFTMFLIDFLTQVTTIVPSDFKLLILYVPVFCTYRILISKFFLKPLSRNIEQTKIRSKFIYRGFDLIHYLTSSILGTVALMAAPYRYCPFYFLNLKDFIAPTGEFFVCSMFEKIYFMYFMSYYVSDIFWVYTTSEIPILVFHHAITISMIVICAICARPAAGLSVMLLHDWVDVFLYTGKIFTYLNWKRAADISLLIFAVLYIYLRLFGVLAILYHLWTDPNPQPHHQTLWLIGRSLVIGLYGCHIVWGSKVIRAIYLALIGEKIRDTRSDDKAPIKKKD